ncbi:unnamed protein product, partial [Pylaiella littoralis]
CRCCRPCPVCLLAVWQFCFIRSPVNYQVAGSCWSASSPSGLSLPPCRCRCLFRLVATSRYLLALFGCYGPPLPASFVLLHSAAVGVPVRPLAAPSLADDMLHYTGGRASFAALSTRGAGRGALHRVIYAET